VSPVEIIALIAILEFFIILAFAHLANRLDNLQQRIEALEKGQTPARGWLSAFCTGIPRRGSRARTFLDSPQRVIQTDHRRYEQ